MIVYAESNFILELAYLQEEHESCERILKLAEAETIRLIVPAFAIAEPFSAWVGRRRRRMDLHKSLTSELKELGRSKPYAGSHEEFQEITKALMVSGENEKLRLDATIERVLAVALLIPIEGNTIRSAIELQKSRRLDPQDSIVYASVLSDLPSRANEPRCFVTKNSRDFATPDIIQELAGYQCELFTAFGAANGFISRQM